MERKAIDIITPLFICIFILIMIITIVAGMEVATEQEEQKANEYSEQKPDEHSWEHCVSIFTDPETGVQYIFYNYWGQAGICPRYNEKGEIMIET